MVSESSPRDDGGQLEAAVLPEIFANERRRLVVRQGVFLHEDHIEVEELFIEGMFGIPLPANIPPVIEAICLKIVVGEVAHVLAPASSGVEG